MVAVNLPVQRVASAIRAATREQVLVALMGIPALLRHPVWRTVNPDEGKGRGVLLVPGFGTGDRSLSLTRTWLRVRGYRPVGARIGLNIGCTTELAQRIERGLEAHVEATGGRVVVIGQSRGGWLGRLLAVRRPDLVRGLVMLGSPVLDPLGAHPSVLRVGRMLTRLSALGVRGLLTRDCFEGDCLRENLATLALPLPAEVPAVSLYSRLDGIAPWRLCLDPHAECVEVRSAHTAMAFDPDVYTAVQPTLAEWASSDEHLARAG